MPVIDKVTGALGLNKSQEPGPNATSPEFDHTKVTVIFVLGGPGAGEVASMDTASSSYQSATGKGTQCARLVEDFGFCHLSGMILAIA